MIYELFCSLQTKREHFEDNYRYMHIDSVNDDVVQLLGAVMNLDLDTILSITPSATQIEVLLFTTN